MKWIKALIAFFVDLFKIYREEEALRKAAAEEAARQARLRAEQVSQDIREKVENVEKPELDPTTDPFAVWNRRKPG